MISFDSDLREAGRRTHQQVVAVAGMVAGVFESRSHLYHQEPDGVGQGGEVGWNAVGWKETTGIADAETCGAALDLAAAMLSRAP